MTRRSKAQWRELVDEQASSGLSASEFCRLKSINPKYFSARKRKFELDTHSFLKVVPPEIKLPAKVKGVKVRVIEFEVFTESVDELLNHLIR